MQILKLYVYEGVVALLLLGIAHVLLVDQTLLLVGKVLLLALYAMFAIATEAVIVSNLRPKMWQALTLNLLIAGAVFSSGWTSLGSLKLSVTIATATLALRLSVAVASLGVSSFKGHSQALCGRAGWWHAACGNLVYSI